MSIAREFLAVGLGTVALGAALVAASGRVAASVPAGDCDGQEATIGGTSGDDVIVGSPDDTSIFRETIQER